MRIGIVNDLNLAVEGMRRLLVSQPQHEVVWVAYNGKEAIALCTDDTPDLILMDLVMPVMNGVEATREIMQTTPCPILVVTASVDGNSSMVFEAMGAGALDAVATPILNMKNKAGAGIELLQKIEKIGKLKGHISSRSRIREQNQPVRKIHTRTRKNCLISIGASTGGPQALVKLLSCLPADFPGSIVIIQHMDEKFSPNMVEWLDRQTEIPIRKLCEGDVPIPGIALIACTDDHVILTENGKMKYTKEPRNNFYHPSVDVFFHSVARNWYGITIGVLLTGMGRDGAAGLLALNRRGWHTIAQDQESSVVYGMPKAAAEIGAAVEILPVCEIGSALIDLMAPKVGIYHE